MLWLQIFAYGVALWMGLYLLARSADNPVLRNGGLGLIAYALLLALDVLRPHLSVARLQLPLLLLPAFFWGSAILQLLPDHRLKNIAGYPALLTIAGLYGLSAATDFIFDYETDQFGAGYPIFALAVAGVLLVSLLLLWRSAVRPRNTLIAATFFFGMGSGALLLPFDFLPRSLLILSIGVDLCIFGYIVGVWDAFEQGENFLADFLASLSSSAVMAVLFGGQIGAVMALSTGTTPAMLILCLSTIAAALVLQTFWDHWQKALDRLVLARSVQQDRADLRGVANALPRVNAAFPLEQIDEAEFNKLTRRALSHLGNLPKLASSPLIQLPVIQERLVKRDVAGNTLEAATELKALLIESITRLKPNGEYGTTDEWRFYNALYFPYVLGLKPYSQRFNEDYSDPAIREVLEWFRTTVPERTLHNWQNAAAALIAKDLR